LDTLFNGLVGSGWEYQKFDLSLALEEEKELAYLYNEFAYFYDYAREALYNMRDFNPKNDKFEDEISYYFELADFKKENSFYVIKIKDGMQYTLAIDGVSLRIFSTGIAILSIELLNYSYPSLQAIKQINEYGRRFYPQYIGQDDKTKALYPEIAKGSFLADSICMQISRKDRDTIKIAEPFRILLNRAKNDIRIGSHISTLLGTCFTQDRDMKEKFYIQPILDDRMFVVCWYGNDVLAQRFTKDNTYTNDNSWYEYVYVDKPDDITVKNDWMKNDLLYQATYDRWSGNKTLFGMTRYSFVALTDRQWYGTTIISRHMRSLYFQMAVLLLSIRASILRFSDEMAAIASLRDYKEEERLSDLYGRYLTFYNRLYFKEITHQDQGIELYDIGLRQMKIPEHIEKLDGKFTKLHDFATLKQNNRESDKVNRLTVLGSLFVIPSVVSLFTQLDMFKPYAVWALILSILLGLSVAYVAATSKLRTNIVRVVWAIGLIGVFVFATYQTNDWGNRWLSTVVKAKESSQSHLIKKGGEK